MTLSDTIQENLEKFASATHQPDPAEVIRIRWIKKMFSEKRVTEKSQEKIWDLGEHFGLTESGRIVMQVTDINRLTDEHGQVIRDNTGKTITGWVVRPADQLSGYEVRLLTAIIESWTGD